MNEWFVYQGEGSHVGPVTTELLVRGIAAGRVPRDAHIAKSGSAEWKPLLTIEEIVKALEAYAGGEADASAEPIAIATIKPAAPPKNADADADADAKAEAEPETEVPLPPSSEADPTEVIRREEMLRAGMAAKARAPMPSVPPPLPKAPAAARTSAPPPPLRPSGSFSAAIAPSKPMIPAAPRVPTEATQGTLVSPVNVPVPVPVDGSRAAVSAAAAATATANAPSPDAPAIPVPPTTVRTLEPEKRFAPPAPPAPAEAPLALAAADKKDEPKKPLVDAKTAFLLPLGTFAVFALLSLVVLVIALVKKPHPASAESNAAETAESSGGATRP